MAEQVVILFAGTEGHLDDVEIKSVSQWEQDFLQYIKDKHSSLLEKVAEEGALSDEIKASIESAIKDFKAGYNPAA